MEFIEYKNQKIEKFDVSYEINCQKITNTSYIILSPAYLESAGGEKMYLPYYCYDEEMNSLEFRTLEEAKKYIDEYMYDKSAYEVKILHRDEISVIPKRI
ncbi:MAG: hypothetical protein K6D97_08695 [Clostridia bacterium]|nr:hypothetical protein [Clostridia bacterium]